jgi:hypothetical protein
MCPISPYANDFLNYSIKIFLIIWIIYVPIVISARLETIIKLLEEKNKK